MKRFVILFFVMLIIAVLVAPTIVIRRNHQYSPKSPSAVASVLSKEPRIAIVFGSGVTKEGPRPTLTKRLDAAYGLYESGSVDHILLSGDNRAKDYDEPGAMYTYLLNKGVSEQDMTKDPAGLSSFQTCNRAVKVYNVSEAVLVSQAGHLDRAIFLCRNLGMNAFGYAAVTEDPVSFQLIREPFSNIKAFIDIVGPGEKTLLSPQPHLQ